MLPARTSPIYTTLKSGLTRLKWSQPPQNIFVVKKDFSDDVLSSARTFIQNIQDKFPVNVLASPESQKELGLGSVIPVKDSAFLSKHADLIVTMGGDGTILHAASLFKSQPHDLPPMLPFSMGTLGFLLPFDFKDAQAVFSSVYNSEAFVAERTRLRMNTSNLGGPAFAMNDVTIHRGGSPHLAQLDIAVNGQHLTTAIADGVTISTPTGSTAYSLSAGGSIVHPGVDCILLTPICPRSLSFRPLLFPSTAHISISVSSSARGPSSISLDGDEGGELKYGDHIEVELQRGGSGGVWCVSQGSETDDWVRHVNGLLGFNSKFGNDILNTNRL